MPRAHRAQFRARTVILEKAAEESSDEAEREFPRFREAWEGLEWLLARSPDRGAMYVGADKETRHYVQASGATEVPFIWVVYTFDDDEVAILDLKVVP